MAQLGNYDQGHALLGPNEVWFTCMSSKHGNKRPNNIKK